MLRTTHWFTLFYVIVLTLLLQLPINTPEVVETVGGPAVKYAHLITFTLLGFLVELGRVKKSMFFWVGVLIAYAVGTEVLQLLLHSLFNRFFCWEDILNNIVGVFLGTLIGYFCRPFVKRSNVIT